MVRLRTATDRFRYLLTGLVLLSAVGLLAAACTSEQPAATEIPPTASTAPADHADHEDTREVQIRQVDIA